MLFDKLGAEVLLAEVRRCLPGAQLCPELWPLAIQSRPQLAHPAPKMGTFGANLVCEEKSHLHRISSTSWPQDLQFAPSPRPSKNSKLPRSQPCTPAPQGFKLWLPESRGIWLLPPWHHQNPPGRATMGCGAGDPAQGASSLPCQSRRAPS